MQLTMSLTKRYQMLPTELVSCDQGPWRPSLIMLIYKSEDFLTISPKETD